MEGARMAWTKPRIVEVCLGMEINCYEGAEL
ncbi:pyrroloquinoline quinone precursor peptide PqqA [Teichococcus rhizosphaerae]|nr:pyrroloquinoline quinone precursor peptide PqqA [Pseudoroseomonas rhizosphaerae]